MLPELGFAVGDLPLSAVPPLGDGLAFAGSEGWEEAGGTLPLLAVSLPESSPAQAVSERAAATPRAANALVRRVWFFMALPRNWCDA